MPEYEANPSNSEYEGCLIALEVFMRQEGELSSEELEDIDDVMENLGAESTGQRIDVTSAGKASTRVKYVYQERLMGVSIGNAKERLTIQKGFKNPTIFIGTEVVELV